MRAAIGAYHPLAARSYGTPTKTDTFTYGNTDWKDQLTAYNGVGITYDGSGNPLSYRGMTLSWQKGRQLASVVKSGVTSSFTYDSRGRRIRKTSGSSVNNQTVTRYYYNGDSLTGLVKGNQTVQFVYDAEGRPFLMRVYTENNTTPSDYYYLYNGQGDVTGLIDSSNSTVVHYTYDSWGKIVSVTDTSNASISTLNPFRYRGYIYDTETELYYLGSRYYDAEVNRFINPDDHNSLNVEQNNLNQFNLYAYCCNNPVDRYDADGEWSLPNWAKVAIGAAVIAGLTVATVMTGGTAGVICGAALYGAVTGGVSGAVISGISGAIAGGWKGAVDGMCSGFLSGTIFGGVTGAITAGLSIATGAVEVVGSAQKTQTLFHRAASNIEAGKIAMNPFSYSKVTLNRSLNTAGLGGKYGRRIPDVIGISNDGSSLLVEVVSKSQTAAQMETKCIKMCNSVASQSNYSVVKWARTLSILWRKLKCIVR